MNMKLTKEDIAAGLEVIRAVADAIRELKRVPSGELYVQLVGTGKLDLAQYTKIVDILKRAGLVTEVNHELIWQEPTP